MSSIIRGRSRAHEGLCKILSMKINARESKKENQRKMKTHRFCYLILSLAAFFVLAIAGSAQAATITLFADTFDRANNANLNASSTGKSGTLGALNWVEVASTGNDDATGSSEIAGNQLKFGNVGGGGGWAIAYPDHNFTDAAISTNGKFTVTTDMGYTGGSAGSTRFNGFAVGHSLAEVNGWSSNNPASFASDFFFGYDPTGTKEVKIFTNGGNEVYQRPVDLGAGAELSVRFTLSDFNSGSTVNYEAFIGGVSEHTGSFTWSGTSENYIAVYSNYTHLTATQDNFEIATIPEPTSLGLIGLLGGLLMLRRRFMSK